MLHPEVFTITSKPIHFVEIPFIEDLTQIHQYNQTLTVTLHDYPMDPGRKPVPGTLAFRTAGANIIDFVGVQAFPVWIIEQRKIYADGDRIVVRMNDGRIFAGISRLLTPQTLILRDCRGINREVIEFSNVGFMGRLVCGMNAG
ncbi:hypothetical protein [Sporolactobacillus vineae]|uniref:hypothetical protein n=1 Tax=Sporolactobacillus vineae TaxID=444463 RepID=UPI000287E205|nr:hypothetical protein [Sporolactobacillus vineae]